MNPVDTENNLTHKRNAFASILMLTGFVLLGLFIGQIIGFLIALFLLDVDMQHVSQVLLNPATYPEAKAPLLIMQAGATLFGFILAPALYIKLLDNPRESALFHQQLDFGLLGVVLLLMLAFMAANSIIIEWNMNIDLSRLSPAFEEWARSKEEQLSELTQYLTRFDNVGGLLIGLLVIAVLPAIGEEIVFRGVLQRKLYHLTNPHAAIWIAAVIFSAIHLQFYGFFPRLLLGALFGYIYYWSGNLWYPVFAHFINNGFTLLMLYLYQQETTSIDIESTEAVPWGGALLALVAGAGLLIYFRRAVMLLRTPEHEQ